MLEWFSVNKIIFTILNYPMSYIEFVGTIFYLWSVWLIARRNILTWPVGIVSVLLYMALFYQIQLYSDTVEQVYYLIASAYGWWRWLTPNKATGKAIPVRWSSWRVAAVWIVVTAIVSALTGLLMSRIHLLAPTWFPQPASLPYLDALTTIMSFSAMWLMAQKRIESWVYWIIVDVIGIGLYYVKDVRFVALLYVILLGMAINGLFSWIRGNLNE
ncbi:nicotinamide mononucleotide transporter PnuC [Candidatus Moduliflexus flocculans]|uniref:Nicotinamide mononucleotide transporter PnuC n=1 Tax=Candidatus Moduliflexus flocculans TaxID=1499966 RepID=A0A0S6W579_9BACT|nr:nicotinamide mononucleotide transporter PnuC [Candidatus Moduliflexus flocculans]